MITATQIFVELKNLSDPLEAEKSLRFFKCEKGQYGEGDKFLGMQLKDVNLIIKKYAYEISLNETEKLLQNEWHEARTTAVSILVAKYEKSKTLEQRKEIVDLYLKNVKYINNWDLVDISCYKILGAYIFETHQNEILYKLASTSHLWSERISIVSCMYLIKKGDFKDILKLAPLFFSHKHDLMHKAVGWMLREVGKMDEKTLLKFLDSYATKLPRTTLRYSLEKLSPTLREHYMKLKLKYLTSNS